MKHLLLWLRAFAGYVAGFAIAAGVISHYVSPPRVSHISIKLDWLRAHPTDYDLLVVGSSRMRQLVPAILDADLGAAGVPVKSFNLSSDGMRPPEASYALDHALASRQAPLKFIVMETFPIALRIDPEDVDTDRVVHWHDTRRIWTIWRRAFAHSIKNPPWFGKWVSDTWRQVRFAAAHTRYYLWNSSRAGRGHQLLMRYLECAPAPRPERGMGVRNDGYIPNDPTPMAGEELRGYLQSMAKLKKLGRQLDPMDSASQAEFRRSAELARQHGAELVIIAPPTTVVEVIEPEHGPGSNVVFLDFSNPEEYPELFDPKVRLNGGHLTEAGCELFTRVVAKKLGEVVSKRQAGK